MIMFCNECEKFFSEDDCGEKEVCLEDEYGVGSEFSNHHYATVETCPHCNSAEIEEAPEGEILDYISKLEIEVKNAKRKAV